jgi:hypothetical protein
MREEPGVVFVPFVPLNRSLAAARTFAPIVACFVGKAAACALRPCRLLHAERELDSASQVQQCIGPSRCACELQATRQT